jgi:hypothetical protein
LRAAERLLAFVDRALVAVRFALVDRALVVVRFGLVERALGLVERALDLVFVRLDRFVPLAFGLFVDFVVFGLDLFAGFVDSNARFAAGTAARAVLTALAVSRTTCFAVALTGGSIGLPAAARLPITAPITPPTTAPTGPAMAPTTAPVAAPAVGLDIGGISIFSCSAGSVELVSSFAIGILSIATGRFIRPVLDNSLVA